MQIEAIFKRSHVKMPYKVEKITEAVLKAMLSVKNGQPKDAENIAKEKTESIVEKSKTEDLVKEEKKVAIPKTEEKKEEDSKKKK